jgi:NADH-quinone oxidoreductase subunit E
MYHNPLTGNLDDKIYSKYQKIGGIIKKHNADQGKLIPILQDVQNIYNYLPEPALFFIAYSLGINPSHVFGVVTFYANFSLEKKGKYVFKICDGTACHVKGSNDLNNKLRKTLNIKEGESTSHDSLFSLEVVSCLGACGLAPAMFVDDIFYGQLSEEKIDCIINDIKNNEVAE